MTATPPYPQTAKRQPLPHRFQRQRHDERTSYIVLVLWLVGHSYSTIAKVVSLRRSQVGGIVDRSEYAGRSSMTIAERQAKLDELKAIRFADGKPLDGGLLNRVPFKVL